MGISSKPLNGFQWIFTWTKDTMCRYPYRKEIYLGLLQGHNLLKNWYRKVGKLAFFEICSYYVLLYTVCIPFQFCQLPVFSLLMKIMSEKIMIMRLSEVMLIFSQFKKYIHDIRFKGLRIWDMQKVNWIYYLECPFYILLLSCSLENVL